MTRRQKARGRGRGTITQRADGRWAVAISSGSIIDPDSGKRVRRRRWAYFTTRDEAERHLTELMGRRDRGTYTEPTRATVGEYLADWLAGRRDLRPSTRESYETNLRVHITPGIGEVRLQKLSPLDLRAFYSRLIDKPADDGNKTRRPMSAKTARNLHALIRCALGDAVEAGLISRNPAALKAARPPRPGRPRTVVPERDTLRVLLDLAPGHNIYGPVVQLAPYVGYRRGEALGLEWSAVDLERGTMRIGQALVRVGSRVEWSEPKTARGRRTLHLAPDAVTFLRAHKKSQNERRLSLGASWLGERSLVFDNGFGGTIDPDAFSHWFRKIARRAGMPGARLHDLRHAFVAMLAAEGVSPLVISEAVGHADVGFTLRQYGYLFDGAGKEIAQATQRALGPTTI